MLRQRYEVIGRIDREIWSPSFVLVSRHRTHRAAMKAAKRAKNRGGFDRVYLRIVFELEIKEPMKNARGEETEG